jgi:hypothetical protein
MCALSTVLAQDRFFSDSLSFALDKQDPQSHHDDVIGCGPHDSTPAHAADLMKGGGTQRSEWFLFLNARGRTHQGGVGMNHNTCTNCDCGILAEGAIALSVTLSGGALFAS